MRLRIELFLRGSGIMRFEIEWPGSEIPTGADIEAAMKEPPPVLELAGGRGVVTWDPDRADGMMVTRLPEMTPVRDYEGSPSSGPPRALLEPLEMTCDCGAVVILTMQDTGRAGGNCSNCGKRYTKDQQREEP